MEDKLVSICVLSFNSSETILETLESIFNQTYKNIELIIADDSSTDKTIEISKDWLTKKGNRFKRYQVITVKKNSGVPANCNRAIKASSGDWIKIIAADDCLLPDCIKDNINYITKNRNVKILYSKYYGFEFKDGETKLYSQILNNSFHSYFNDIPSRQLKKYIHKGVNIMPTMFIAKELILMVGGFIEKYKLFEDTPFICKVLMSDIKIHYLPKYTVLYRVNNNSITKSISYHYFYNESFEKYKWQFRKDMIYPLFKWFHIIFWMKEISTMINFLFATKILKNNKTTFNKGLFIIFKTFNPYITINYFLSKLHKLFS